MTRQTNSELEVALNKVNWNDNSQEFCSSSKNVRRFEKCNFRLAIWSRQFEIADRGNPALSFIRQMQYSGFLVPALTSLALYRPAASTMRTILESALYYSYFRTHSKELETLANNVEYFLTKKEVIDFHNAHSRDFKELQTRIGLVSKLNGWYSNVSAIVHGQMPEKWAPHDSLESISHQKGMIDTVLDCFEECEKIVHHFFLCTLAQDLWSDFSREAKIALLKSVPGDIKATINLDTS